MRVVRGCIQVLGLILAALLIGAAPAAADPRDLASYAEGIAKTAPPSEAPTAQIGYSVPDPAMPKQIRFDGSGSTDPDGTIASYAWDFGDGATGTGATTDHAYTTVGYHYVTLRVTDDSGVDATTATYVYVYTASPTATFSATPASGPAPLTVAFDAGGSTDTDGLIASYAWNFGDGTTGTGLTTSHEYAFAGLYYVTLQVTDNDGAASSYGTGISVGGEHAPTASFTLAPDHGTGPLEVTADASASSDPDGSIGSYAWNFGDGATGSGAIVQHTFAPGTFTVALTVTDDSGAKANATKSITLDFPNRPPQAVDDTLSAVGTGTVDALANDSDPDGDTFTIVATGAPAHGSAHCSALGACDYDADAGYAGSDEFTYTARDPAGLEATATVHVNVSAPPPGNERLSPLDDDVATRADTPVQVAVLDNDAGPGPLTVTAAGAPGHGTASCADGVHCTYEPEPGFSGTDGFTYTVRDATSATATAAVHVTVAPPSAGFSTRTAGAPSAGVAEGERASWTVAAPPAPEATSDDAFDAVPAPAITARLDGPHDLDDATIKAAKGWSVQTSARRSTDRTIRAAAGTGALLGEAVSQPFPRPLPPISQGTGGDGHVPILVGTRVFAFFHHSYPTSVTCVERLTGQLCPGYPRSLPFGTTNIPGPGAVVGSRIYVHLLLAGGYAQSGSLGLFCWDAASNRSCGMIIVDRVPGTGHPTGSAPVLVGGRIYLAGTTGRLYCVDPATATACASSPSLPTGLDAGSGSEYDIVAHGSRIFVSQLLGARVACIDVAAGGPCTGWPQPRTLGEYNVVNQYDSSGLVVGVCTVTSGPGHCVRDDDPATTTTIANWPSTDGYYQITQEAETGTRTLVGSLNRGGVGCWDWTTLAPCTGGDYDSGGWLERRAPERLRRDLGRLMRRRARRSRARSSRPTPAERRRARACRPARRGGRSTCATSAATAASARPRGRRCDSTTSRPASCSPRSSRSATPRRARCSRRRT